MTARWLHPFNKLNAHLDFSHRIHHTVIGIIQNAPNNSRSLVISQDLVWMEDGRDHPHWHGISLEYKNYALGMS